MTTTQRITRLIAAVGARGVQAASLDDVETALGSLGISVDRTASLEDRIAQAEVAVRSLGTNLDEFDDAETKDRRALKRKSDEAAARAANEAAAAKLDRVRAKAQAASDAVMAARAADLERARKERLVLLLEADAVRLAEEARVMVARAAAARAELST